MSSTINVEKARWQPAQKVIQDFSFTVILLVMTRYRRERELGCREPSRGERTGTVPEGTGRELETIFLNIGNGREPGTDLKNTKD